MNKVLIGTALFLLLSAGQTGVAAEPSGRNPFARPARGGLPASAPQPAAAPAFSLRATMAAGASSLVNIDGRIVAIGEVYAGFRLVSVGEGSAVFARNGIHFPVTVSTQDGDQG
ncbi:MAG TPA: hypothetical protein VM616_05580 [Gammaproteobacteria bacterium]|nr:hypothetical protein [Gammaproteobacteria bacterium]